MKIKTGHGSISLIALLAIYSISMVTSLPGLAISPILGHLENIFKNANELQLQLLESLPSFIIVPFILLAGRLSLKINKKKILIIGLSVFFVSSIIYPFANSLKLLLYISALLGVGAGMIIPFSTGIVADYFSGPARTRQLGYVSSINNLTLVLATLLSGFLAGINWHYSFLVYCLSGISLFFSFFLENKPPYLKTENTGNQTGSHPSTKKFRWPIRLMLLYFFITFLVLSIPFNLAIYMHDLKIGSSDTSGTLISVFFLSITLPGFFLNRILHTFKKYTNFISMVLISIGLTFFAVVGGMFLLTLGVIFSGFGYGIMQPIIYDKTASGVNPAQATYALSLVMVMNYIAIVAYPFILSAFSQDASYFPFLLTSILSVAFTIFSYFRLNKPALGIQETASDKESKVK